MKNLSKNLIRFDWALKRLLRNKANFDVLEGFLTVLLGEKITITGIVGENDKLNRTDILAYNAKNEIIVIEVQITYHIDYCYRMLFGVSRAIIDHLKESDKYDKVRKVYHINILYFEIGQGQDYVYHGKNEFTGINYNDVLQLTEKQKKEFKRTSVSELFPEYYILRVNNFNNVAKNSLDEWIYYLKNDRVLGRYETPGLDFVQERLHVESLSEEERRDYDHHIDQVQYEDQIIHDNYELGVFNGEKKGKAEGLAEGKAEGLTEGEAKGEKKKSLAIATRMLKEGFPIPKIAELTGLSEAEIQQL
jgi:predicted transposase/invertase (TIGR01784 family)